MRGGGRVPPVSWRAYELPCRRHVVEEAAAVAFREAAGGVARPAAQGADVGAHHVDAERAGLAVGVPGAAGAGAVAVAEGQTGALAAAVGEAGAPRTVRAAAAPGAAVAFDEALARF